jgi:hypothetical protein
MKTTEILESIHAAEKMAAIHMATVGISAGAVAAAAEQHQRMMGSIKTAADLMGSVAESLVGHRAANIKTAADLMGSVAESLVGHRAVNIKTAAEAMGLVAHRAANIKTMAEAVMGPQTAIAAAVESLKRQQESIEAMISASRAGYGRDTEPDLARLMPRVLPMPRMRVARGPEFRPRRRSIVRREVKRRVGFDDWKE